MASGSGPAATPGAAPAAPTSRPRARALLGWALLVVWGVTAAGCAGGPGADAAARAPVLYVGNGRDGTVTRLDAGAGGHTLGAPLPAGEAPWQLAVGPAGELLVLPVTARPGVGLTYVTRDPRGPGGWRARPVPLEPGARAPLLAGAGRFAVVAYQAGGTPVGPQPARCRVALFDLGRRLYAAEALPAPDVAPPDERPTACESAGYRELFEGAPGWRVWGLDATTLDPAAEHTLAHPVRALAVTPDGDDAFALAGLGTVLRLAPAGGPAVWVTALPEMALGLAATDDRLYTLDVLGDRVWGLDRRRGALVQTLATGRRPIGIVLAGG